MTADCLPDTAEKCTNMQSANIGFFSVRRGAEQPTPRDHDDTHTHARTHAYTHVQPHVSSEGEHDDDEDDSRERNSKAEYPAKKSEPRVRALDVDLLVVLRLEVSSAAMMAEATAVNRAASPVERHTHTALH